MLDHACLTSCSFRMNRGRRRARIHKRRARCRIREISAIESICINQARASSGTLTCLRGCIGWQSTGNQVAALREELAILEVEVHESQQLLEHETAQRDFLVDIIQSAQRELLAQQHDRDLFRKQALEMKRRATNRAALLANFKQANFILLDTLVLD